MRNRTLRNTIVTGKLTLPISIVLAALMWTFTERNALANWAGYLMMVLITLVLQVMSNTSSIIRVRSWFLSSCFIILCGLFTFQHTFDLSMLSELFYLIALFFLFSSYQQIHAEKKIFQAFFFLGLSSILMPQLLFMSFFFFVAMLVQLRVFTLRTVLAALIGIFVAIEIIVAFYFLSNHQENIVCYFNNITSFNPQHIKTWNLAHKASIGFVMFLVLLSVLHYSRTHFNDKIRTRMFFYIIITQEFILLGLLALCPDNYKLLSGLILLESAPLLAHYFVLTRGWIVDIFFFLTFILLLLLTAFNLWNPSSLSF